MFGSKDEGRQRTDGKHSSDKKPKDKQTGHGPTPQPDLPIEEVVHHLDDADCCCPKCGSDLRKMARQFEETELISAVQVRYVLQIHKAQKYHCGGCGHIEAAIGPLRLIPGGRYDLPFAVQVAVSKYLDHLPLERQVVRMGRRGLRVTSQTLWDQLFALYCVLLPTFIALQVRVLTSPLLHVDETRWRLMGKGGKRRSAKWWLWTLTGSRGVLFDILPTRGSAAAKLLLQDYAGVLVADGYGVYASLEKALDRQGGVQINLETGEPEVLPNYLLAGCWMHARRPFIKAEASAPEVGHALDLIAELYAIEARAREAAEEAITSTLLDVTIDGARGILFNITGGPDLTLFEVNQAAAIIKETAHPDVNLIFGAVIDPSLTDEIRLTVIATGFDANRMPRRSLRQRAKALASSESDGPAMNEAELEPSILNVENLDIPTFLRKRVGK
ncbi:MAG: IS66 family transposase [Chloroflexi bacterium]|nr:IS66 family transposase [Chloroflexota bacterium]